MATTNENNLDAGSRFWADDHSGSSNKPFELTSEAVHEDTAAAYRESQGRAERDEQIERARPDIEFHQALHGGLGPALEFDRAASQGLRDPDHWHATATHLHRTFAKKPPTVLPAKPVDEKPPADLDERGLRDWQYDQDAKHAYRDAAREKAYREDVAAAAPQLAQAAMDHPNTPLDVLIAQGSAAKQVLEVKPEAAWKLAKYGAAPADEQQAQEQHATAQAQQWTNGLMGQIEQAKQSGAFAGFDRPIAEHMAVWFDHMARTGQLTDYNVAVDAAHQYATYKVQEQAEQSAAMHQRLYGEIIPSGRYPELKTEAGRQAVAQIARDLPESGDWERDLHRAYEIFREQRHGVAVRARQASRSISGSPGSSVSESDYGDGSVEDAARAAWRSVTNSTYV